MLENNFTLTSKQITGKILSLKNYFCKERGKVNCSKKSGAAESDVYKVRWKFYESLKFLDEHISPKPTVSSFTPSRSSSTDSSTSEVNSPALATPTRPFKTARTENGPNENSERIAKLMDTAASLLARPEVPSVEKDEDDIFGDLLVKMLKRIPNGQTKDMLKINLQQMVCHVSYGGSYSLQNA